MGDARFEAMGSWGHVVVVGGPADACARAVARVDDLERRWSRFLPESEISRMNRAPGGVVVSEDTVGLVRRAQAAHRATGGRFDAHVLAAVVGAGYDRAVGVVTNASPLAGFDPGGIGKGYAADLVVEELMGDGAAGACVNLGGDLRVEGTPPGGAPWVIDVEDPFGGAPLTQLGLRRGAVATSNRLRRSWAVDGKTRHHLIDPATGRPAATDAVAVTVVAGEAWWAEALSTAAMVAGVAAGLDLIEANGAAGLIVDEAGGRHDTPGLQRYLP